jgi:threonylcarbamoyladenosine tRNA methylthiotransferase MtaB
MKYSVLSFGCRTNQADACEIERELRAGGGVPAPSDSADVVVVNTCSVTVAADQAARNAIRRVARLNPRARILATGCYATRRPDEVGLLPGVARLLLNDAKVDGIAATLIDLEQIGDDQATPGRVRGLRPGDQARTAVPLHVQPVSDPRPGDRGRTAYPLRVQTGCDEACSYCIVPSTRGPSRSRPVPEVLEDVRRLAAAGFKELWLTGVHLGSYGRDLRPSCALLDLLVALDRQAESLDVTFRLSSIEPMDCGDDVLELVAASPRFVPHLHLPLQHASDRMLQAMRRPYSAAGFRMLVRRARDHMPDAAIGTDLIVGFPGETERDFEEQVSALGDLPLTHVHVFPYSDRPGTEASRLPSKVAGAEVRRRAEHLRAIGRELTRRFVQSQVGHERSALTLEDGSVALTDNYMKVRIAPSRVGRERLALTREDGTVALTDDHMKARIAPSRVGRERLALTREDGAVAPTDDHMKVRIAGGRTRNERVLVKIVSVNPLWGEVVA